MTNIKENKSLKRNLIFNFIIQFLTYLFPLILSPYLARVLGPEAIGISTFSRSIVNYFVYIIAFGFVLYGTKKIAANSDDKESYSSIFWSIFFAKMFLFILASSAFFCTFSFTSILSDYQKYIYLYSILLLGEALNISYLFQGLERFKILSILNVFFRTACLVACFIFVKGTNDLSKYVLIYSIQTVGVSITSLAFLPKLVTKPVMNFKTISEAFKDSLIFFIPSFSVFLGGVIDITVLGVLSGDAQVGFYEESNKINTLIVGLIGATYPVFLSRMTRISKSKDNKSFSLIMEKMLSYYFLITIPIVLGLYCINDLITLLFFGDGYVPSIYINYYLFPYIIFNSFSQLLVNSYYLPKNKNKQLCVYYVVFAILNLFLNIPLVYFMDAAGAALSTSISGLVLVIMFILGSRKEINYLKIFTSSIKPTISSLIMVAMILLTNLINDFSILPIYIKLMIIISSGIIIYSLCLFILRDSSFMSIFRKERKK